jgi:phytoene desaturase
MSSAFVIGAGIGGITAAARLARAGYDVTVFERSSHAGGRTNYVEQEGFRFDTGPTLFLMPDVFAQTYAALGEKMEDHLKLNRIDPTYRVNFHDGSYIDLTADLVAMRERLNALEPGVFRNYVNFLNEGCNHYYGSLDKFVGRNFRNIFEYFSITNLPLIFQLKALMKHYSNVSRYFKSDKLRAAFSFQNMYLGVSPYDALATYSLLQYTELGEGIWFPDGGMYRVIESLTQIAEGLGVTFRYNTPVEKIKVSDTRAEGVVLEDGETIKADVVVANADLPYVYRNMLPDDGTAAKLNKMKYTSSALMFYWGVKGKLDQLHPHNVFLADHQYRDSFKRIFRDLTLPDEPSIYMHIPSQIDPSFAPPDSSCLTVLVPVGHINEEKPQDWDELQKQARVASLTVLKRLGVTDIEERIVTEATITPPDYEQMNLVKGSAFGLSHNFMQVGYLRPQNRHATYENLYFSGASTHPGTGLPIVLLSAQLTVERILQEQGEPK